MKRGILILGFAALAIGTSWLMAQKVTVAQSAAKSDLPLAHAKREMAMLDDLYKTAIVLITTHYVDGKESLAAGSAFKALFDGMKEKKWHEVRLIDGTGDPYEPANKPGEGFEQRAMKDILSGKSVVQEVREESGRRYLLGATAIPVVMEKCTVCHDNYSNVAPGKAIGALSYKLPIQDKLSD
jgi:hypothetical protein